MQPVSFMPSPKALNEDIKVIVQPIKAPNKLYQPKGIKAEVLNQIPIIKLAKPVA